ncbi:hypothetical protein EAS61_05005 [Bradyrhizobium zhanjiangense]|uniref:Uncharacterized protein n=1 Tax=Bradyrhizobium zhanjiangense TaxID=1325107 RepID=A0A4Q0QY22_9BRAD|nr:hypothetical protein EAS61_05005 [Bradyrhizobium zhanjiangense]
MRAEKIEPLTAFSVIASEAKQSRNESAKTIWIASSHQHKIASQFCPELLAMTEPYRDVFLVEAKQ